MYLKWWKSGGELFKVEVTLYSYSGSKRNETKDATKCFFTDL
jgi:hypothetical protein